LISKSKKARRPVPSRPFYISDSESVNWKWSQDFAAALPPIAAKYGISDEQVAKVVAAALVIETCMGRLQRAKLYYEECIVCKDSYFDMNPDNPTQPVPIPSPPVESAAPSPLPPNILQIFIQTAQMILAQNPPEADMVALGLKPAEGKPLPPEHKVRVKVADSNYPLPDYKVQGNIVTIRVKRGNAFLGKLLRLIVDREGKGEYVEAGVTDTKDFSLTYSLPEGVQAGVWLFKGVFLNGQEEVSEWSPELPELLTRQVQLVTLNSTSLQSAVANVSNGAELVSSLFYVNIMENAGRMYADRFFSRGHSYI
jgi:hypothetical protein